MFEIFSSHPLLSITNHKVDKAKVEEEEEEKGEDDARHDTRAQKMCCGSVVGNKPDRTSSEAHYSKH